MHLSIPKKTAGVVGQIYELCKSVLAIARKCERCQLFHYACRKIATILRHLWLVKAGELGRAKGQLKEAGRKA